MNEELFYLRDIRTGMYHSISGLTSSKEDATKFTEIQLKNRLGVAKTHTNVFYEKLRNSNMVMEPTHQQKQLFKLESDIDYEDDDILICRGEYYYGDDLVVRDVIYSVKRNIIRKPKDKNVNPDRIVFKVLRKYGKVNPD